MKVRFKKVDTSLSKRQKIIFTSLILSVGLLYTQFVPFYLIHRFVFVLAVLAYILSLWTLWVGIDKLKALVLLILPTLFTLAFSSYYLLIVSDLTRVLVAIGFGLTFYALLLSENIFNVSSTRTIPLYRVAYTIAFVLTIITSSLLYVVIFSLPLLFIWRGLLVFLLTFILCVHIFWTTEMEKLDKKIIIYSTIVALIIGEEALALCFWPISNILAGMILSVSLYFILGIMTDYLRERLSREVMLGYLRWGAPIFISVFLLAYLATSWRG